MFKKVKKCRFCESKLIADVLDLGKQPLANGLLKKIKKKFKKNSFKNDNLQKLQITSIVMHSKTRVTFLKLFMGHRNI